MKKNSIVILDFGSQYNQLVLRRIRQMGVFASIVPFDTKLEEIKKLEPIGIILSGGPSSVKAKDARLVSKELFDLNIPVLGICYGMQLISFLFGGHVSKGVQGEYGKSTLFLEDNPSLLFKAIPNSFEVWMSHFDHVEKLPNGFQALGYTNSECLAAIANEKMRIYGVQFHPEVSHCQYGKEILSNFIFEVCKAQKNWKIGDFATESITEIKNRVKSKKVILGFSGGVDSSVTALLIHKAIGESLICIFVDTGLLRKDEVRKVMHLYKDHFHLNIKVIDAKKIFLKALEGVVDPEKKRKIIGKEFVNVFQEEASKIEGAKYLAQGTICSDVIESSSSKGASSTIKSHHNVGGPPKKINLELLEPIRDLFKDEVRDLGKSLGLSNTSLNIHPFPGPGLAIRIVGEITEEKISIVQEADSIFIEELHKNSLYEKVGQAFVILLPIRSVGVMGDERTYEYTIVLRAMNSTDFMTANWVKFPHDFLERVSSRITNEVKGINRVVYDITSKPPATIEWE